MFDPNDKNPMFQIGGISDDEPDLIPLLSSEDEETMNSESVPEVLAILPLRNTVLFPGVVIPITVGRDRSIHLIKDAYKADKIIGVVAQKDSTIEDPHIDDLHPIGTVAHIIKMLRMPDGNTTVIIQGKRRFRVDEVVEHDPYLRARIT
ncbi:MAG: endopeptidase La, partial [Bacteroidota bacterium]